METQMADLERANSVLRNLLRSLDVKSCCRNFPEAAQEARDFLAEQGIAVSHSNSRELVEKAEAMGIEPYTGAQRYGDDHPTGCFMMTLDLEKAQLIERLFHLERGNAPEFYDIAAIEAAEDKNDMSVWVEYGDDERFIEIMAEDANEYIMVFGEARLPDIVKALET